MKSDCIDTGRDIRKMLPTGPLDDSAVGYAKAFMATPKKKNSKDTSDITSDASYIDNSEISGSTTSASDAGQETEASDESLNRSANISGLSSIEDSVDDLKPSSSICQKQTRRMQTKSQESHRRSQKKKGSYICPTESEKVRNEAQERFVDALNQVPDEVHFNLEGQRTTTTLYVGNLDYNSDSKPLHKALQKYFRYRIKVEETLVPENNGKSRGFAFVTLSWAKAANVNPSDICKAYSGMIDVNSRYIYLRELRNDHLQTGYLGRRGPASIARM